MARKSRKTQIIQKVSSSNYKVAIYVRLSVEDNNKRGDSIEIQQHIIENYIALNPDFEIYDTYIDNGFSGVTFEREGFNRLLSDIEKGVVNCIIVKDLSRLGRNVIDTGYYIEKYFPTKNIRFISVNDSYDSNDKDNVQNGIILPLKNMIHEAYALDLSRKTRAQQHQFMLSGQFIGALPPFGYLKSPEDCHKLIIDPETASIVKQIFEWAHEKVTITEIAKRLNTTGTLTPGKYFTQIGLIKNDFRTGKGEWQTRTVHRIISDEVYIGNLVQGKSKTFAGKQTYSDEKDWIKVENTHEAIVDKQLFLDVNCYRKQVANEWDNKSKKPYTQNILKGKIYCSCCGKNLHRQRNKAGNYYFHCLSNSRVKKGMCDGLNIMEKELFDLLITVIQKKSEILSDGYLTSAKADVDKSKQTNSNLSSLKRKAERDRKYLKSLYENLISGTLTDDEYLSLKSDYEDKINATLSEIGLLESEQKSIKEKREKYKDMSKNTKKLNNKKPVLTAEIVDKLIDRITINSKKEIELILNFESEFGEVEV